MFSLRSLGPGLKNTPLHATAHKPGWTFFMTRPDAPDARPLDTIRAELDAIDERIHALVVRRAGLADEVRRAKTDTGAAALRPAREAQMLRRLSGLDSGAMELGQIWRLWRELIMANARLQFPFVVDTVAASHDHGLWDMGRAHFCFETEMEAHDTSPAALARAAAGPARVALLRTADTTWWSDLAGHGGRLRVFNALPMIAAADGEAPSAMVIGDVALSESGDDVTVLLVRASSPDGAGDAVRALRTAEGIGLAYSVLGGGAALVGWRGFHQTTAPALAAALGGGVDVAVIGIHPSPVVADGAGTEP